MLPRTCVVVPTYWTRAGEERRPGDAVYDHPTPVDGDTTLTKLLDSLVPLDTSSFYLLVLVAVTGEDAADDAERRMAEIVDSYPSLTSVVFGPSDLARLHQTLSAAGYGDAHSFLDLSFYPKVRNLQLAIPLALGSDAIVALDDDEIIDDPEFIHKAVEPLGSTVNGHRVEGLSGYYVQEDGGIMLGMDPDKAKSHNIYDRKAAIMNQATEKVQAEPGNVVPTPFCFGGNMEFTADLAASVGFDPGITRGEDIDYLINARLENRWIFMRKDLRILHRPPEGGSYKDANWSKLEQDVYRFEYEREKLRASQQRDDLAALTVDDLMPYPGEFLSADTTPDALEALRAAGYPHDPGQLVEQARAEAPGKVETYLRFRERWPQVMAHLRQDEELRDRLEGQAQNR